MGKKLLSYICLKGKKDLYLASFDETFVSTRNDFKFEVAPHNTEYHCVACACWRFNTLTTSNGISQVLLNVYI